MGRGLDLGCEGGGGVEGNESEEGFVGHFGEEGFGGSVVGEKFGGGGFFGFDHGVDAFLDGASGDEFVDEDIALLADAVGAVGGLVFDGGVPPAVEVNDVAGCR